MLVSRSGLERSYIFAVASLIFGLPLVISFYPVQNDTSLGIYFSAAYIAFSFFCIILLLFTGGEKGSLDSIEQAQVKRTGGSLLAGYISLALATVAVASFAAMRYSIVRSYPYPSSAANIFGGVYIFLLSLAFALGFPFLILRSFSVAREALSIKVYSRLALITGIAYFITYEVLVNEIVITGFNTSPGNFVPSPSGHYPWVYVFTGGPSPSSILESFIYVPYVLIQLNTIFNFFFVPIEIVFAIILSTLMGIGIPVMLYSIKRSALVGAACTRGAALSSLGGFIGYTATCPSCLAPTLISALFGGFSAAQSLYTNSWGILIPPLVSLIALLGSMITVERLGKPPSKNVIMNNVKEFGR